MLGPEKLSRPPKAQAAPGRTRAWLRRQVVAVSGRFVTVDRQLLANTYVQGTGIEIGALHNPLHVPHTAHVCYVDRMSVPELRKQYPELANLRLVPVDIIDDGETLATIPDDSQDFVIANHALEHFQNPIGALRAMLRVLRPGGIAFIAVPDKRYTFDIDRPVTTLEHLIRDDEQGPASSLVDHYQEWSRLVDKVPVSEVESYARELMQSAYSIHFHVWTSWEFAELLVYLRRERNWLFDLKASIQQSNECVLILQKMIV